MAFAQATARAMACDDLCRRVDLHLMSHLYHPGFDDNTFTCKHWLCFYTLQRIATDLSALKPKQTVACLVH